MRFEKPCLDAFRSNLRRCVRLAPTRRAAGRRCSNPPHISVVSRAPVPVRRPSVAALLRARRSTYVFAVHRGPACGLQLYAPTTRSAAHSPIGPNAGPKQTDNRALSSRSRRHGQARTPHPPNADEDGIMAFGQCSVLRVVSDDVRRGTARQHFVHCQGQKPPESWAPGPGTSLSV